jgi:integrase/recombinase XerD
MSSLNQVFVRVHARYDKDRYAEDLERFAEWLLANEFTNKTARTHLFRVQQVLHSIGAQPGAPLRADLVHGNFRRFARRKQAYRNTQMRFTAYLRSINRLIEPSPSPPSATDVLLNEFCEQLQGRRGLAPATIVDYRFWISDFLRRSLPHGGELADLRGRALQRYVTVRAPTLVWVTLHGAINRIQAFLRYGYHRGLLVERINHIELPRGFRPDRPPRAMPWIDIQRLLASIDRTRCRGGRDYAILHLMAHYGLRTGEIPALTLDSINWQARTLTVWRSKTRSTTILPLHEQTVGVLKAYLKDSRPPSGLSFLFLTGSAPRKGMTKFLVSSLFSARLRRSGLPNRHYTAYSLRHAFAMRLFQQGVGMKAIGDLMGHRDLISTAIYLRLQADVLREAALPVPQLTEEKVA